MTDLKMTPTTNDALAGGPKIPPGASAVPPHMIQLPIRPNPLAPRKVAIVGTQPSSRMLAPYNDPDWTIWGSSPGNMNILPRCDAWFEMHCNLLWPEYKMYGEPYVRWLADQPFPVICQDQSFLPKALSYPLEIILAKFGRPQPYFFTSTFAWMMAMAIHLGVEEMGLFGVDMSSRDEYILQRAGGHHFICVAHDHGIRVHIPDESDLAQPPPLYGYSDSTPFGRKMASREQEVKERIAQLEQQVAQANSQLVYLKGAQENQQYMRQVYGSVDRYSHQRGANQDRVAELQAQVIQLDRAFKHREQQFLQRERELAEQITRFRAENPVGTDFVPPAAPSPPELAIGA